MLIKYDPRDLSRIFVRRPDGSYIEARYRNLAYPAVTIWEWRGKRDLDEDAIFSALALQRRTEDDAVANSTAARRKAAKRPRVTKEQSTATPLSGIDTSKEYPGADDLEFNEFGSSSSCASSCGTLEHDG